jgi:hypothetical protein
MRTSIIVNVVTFAILAGAALLAALGQHVIERARARDASVTIDPIELTKKADPLPLQFYDVI